MTPTPLSPEARASLVEKAKAATPGPWTFEQGDHSHRYAQVTGENELIVHYKYASGPRARAEQEARDAAFIAAANPATILSLDATVQALTVERDAALERVKALEAGLREIVVECASRDLLPNHFRIQIEHLAKGALTPKDPGHG